MSIGSIIVAHQIGRRRCPGEGLSDLAGQPLGCRMSRDLKPQQLSPAVAQDQKREQSLKGQRRDHAHINSSGHLHVVSKKRPPGLRRRPATLHHVFGDRRLGDFEPQHQQFAMDPGRTPERILFAHPSDEIAQLTIDLWPPCPIAEFPAPKRFEAGAMPSQDGFRLHDPGYVEQTGPNPRHPYQQRPITAVQPQPRRRSPQCDVKLMMKKQVLGFQPASRLENADNEDPEHVQDRKHRPG